jgi:hypothetical protein
MKRNRFLFAFLGMLALLIAAVVITWSVARADLAQSTATQIFKPDFDEWAFLYLTAAYRDYSGQTHFVTVGRASVNGKVRYKIAATYAKSPAGQTWFDNVGSKIRKSVEADCKRWTAEGFPIDLNDFQIEINQASEKAQ